MSRLSITVVGAGVTGLWQAYEMARRGHAVTLREATAESAPGAASRFAGAMLAPYCEAEAAPPLVQHIGEHHASARCQQRAGEGFTQSARATGDHHPTAGQVHDSLRSAVGR